MELIEFRGRYYPKFQASGFASRFAFPYALEVCTGRGYDIGCGKKDWKLPGSMPIDVNLNDGYSATNLPEGQVDFIFSSHCLEHLPDWVEVLDYWTSCIKEGGALFLYLPDYSQEYWRPWFNRKHKNIFVPEIIEGYMRQAGYVNIFKSGVDLNNSFMIYGEKNNN